MRVQNLHSKIQHGLIQGKAPKAIIINLGGNNIPNTNQGKFVRILKKEIQYISHSFNNALIIWTFILPRLAWTNVDDHHNLQKMNNKRNFINRTLCKFTLNFTNGRALNIKSIDKETTGFFHSDKIHLSTVGKEMYIHAIVEAVGRFLTQSPETYIEI